MIQGFDKVAEVILQNERLDKDKMVIRLASTHDLMSPADSVPGLFGIITA